MQAHRLLIPALSITLLAAGGIWLSMAGGMAGDDAAPAPGPAASASEMASEDSVLLPLPPPPDLPPARVALGAQLFADKRLSHDGSISCASCHDLAHGGADGAPVSTGIGGQRGTLNAPTVFNAALNLAQFWDGRAATLADQVAGPVHNPVEMGSNWREALARLGGDRALARAFAAAYPDGLTIANLADAIATYEQTLLTPDSRFDRYLRGERTALDARELAGYRRFLVDGCASCHQGAGIGGNMFQRFGVMDDYFRGRPVRARDLGRFNVTGREKDRHVFKVPSLRNVAVTAPYFHGGSARTLEQAIRVMGRYQLGRDLGDAEVADIAAFLGTLTGRWQGRELSVGTPR